MALFFALALGACQPTCRDTCRKLIRCEEVDTPRLSIDECTDACLTQQKLYDEWEDESLRDAFADQKQCINDEECGAIADGVCYDPELFAW